MKKHLPAILAALAVLIAEVLLLAGMLVFSVGCFLGKGKGFDCNSYGILILLMILTPFIAGYILNKRTKSAAFIREYTIILSSLAILAYVAYKLIYGFT